MKNRRYVVLLFVLVLVVSISTSCYRPRFNKTSVDMPDGYKLIRGGAERIYVITDKGELYTLDGKDRWILLPPDMSGVQDMDVFDYRSKNEMIALRDDGTVFIMDLFTFESVEIPLPEKVRDVEIGFNSYAAITEDGDLYLWGSNLNGSLGNGTEDPIDTPYRVDSLKNVTRVICEKAVTLVLTSDGRSFYAGVGAYQPPDRGVEILCVAEFTPITNLPSIKDIGLLYGGSFYFLDQTGHLYLWGAFVNEGSPKFLNLNTTFVDMKTGHVTLLMLDENGTVHYAGILKFGNYTEQGSIPQPVSGLGGMDRIFESNERIYAQKGDQLWIIEQANQGNPLGYK